MARILIIDDEIVIRRVVRKILEAVGHEVIEAENGKTGVEVFRAQDPGLVITDIIMQGQGGLETIVALRRERPDAKIIAISGGSLSATDNLAIARSLGAQHTLRKPFSIDELRRAVSDLLTTT